MNLIKFSPIVFLLILSKDVEAREAGPQGIFELRLKHFHNNAQKDSSGRCCKGLTSPGPCAGTCDTKFRVCLKHYMAQVDFMSSCTFGEQITGVVGSNNLNVDLAPIQFDIDFKWPGTFSLIIEAWHEGKNTGAISKRGNDSLLHRVVAKSRSLDSGSRWIGGEDSRLDFDYRLVCADNYYGKDCDIICKPRDDNFGHYTCGPEGEKICLPGWEMGTGGYCSKPKCSPGCNAQNGYCKKPGECICQDGWQGPGCTECKRYPGCVHGTCSARYTCECKTGWGGLLCNKDLNFCTNHRPCHNGATCFNTGDDYTCSCPIGFSGRNCETRVVSKCMENPCKNSGECLPGRDEDYTCQCKAGSYGHHCEFQSDFDVCSTNPCDNGATCTSGMSGYTCTCPPGFQGRNCEINTNDCEMNPCRNGGTCHDFINSYKCICPLGYIGKHCEENYNDCKNTPCANGGTCRDGVNDFTCMCTPGYTGKDCSLEINECEENPCLNGGFCIDGNNTFNCRCLPRHTGKYCEILPDGSIDPKYYELKGVPTNAGNSGNAALIGTFSALVPLMVIVAAIIILCMKQRRKIEQQRADFEAQLENELNAVNSMNKTKILDDHMIVNSLDYPQKSINTNPNLAEENNFSAKESQYAQMSRAKSTKQLNTDSVQRSSMYCDKVENSYTRSKIDKSRFGGLTKSTNLDISSSTLCSSSSEKSGFKKDLNRDMFYSGGASCGSASPAPSSVYNMPEDPGKCIEDDLLATEV